MQETKQQNKTAMEYTSGPGANGKNQADAPTISIVIPAKNEARGLRELLPSIRKLHPKAEIIVVNDGSTDDTFQVCKEAGVKIISHRYTMGNGASVKTGARAAQGDVLVFMDGDGQHRAEDISSLLDKLDEGYDMVVGARSWESQAGLRRAVGNRLYNTIASWMTGRKIEDLTSGFRAVYAEKFKKFLYLLPNGFSYPTTITMAFFRSAYAVTYMPIQIETRKGLSNINILRDGIRFFIIILRVGALFSPMRLFLPVSFFFFLLGVAHYSYTYFTAGRFTNMSALMFIASMLTFLIGIVSEQISSLHYKGSSDDK